MELCTYLVPYLQSNRLYIKFIRVLSQNPYLSEVQGQKSLYIDRLNK